MKTRGKCVATVVAGCALALSVGLVGCGGPSTDAAEKTEEVAKTEPVSEGTSLTDGSSSGGTPEPDPAPAPSPAQGTPQIAMGDFSLVHVHETDAGVGADVVIQVTNSGDVPLVMSNPVIRIADENGSLIVEDSGDGVLVGPTCLGVKDVGFIYSSRPIALPAGHAPGGNYLAQGSADLVACADVHQFPVGNLAIGDGGRELPTVTGTVTNDEAEDVPSVEVTVAYMDNDGHMLGVAGTTVPDLAAGASRDFSIDGSQLPVGCTLAMVSDYDVMAAAPKF